MADEKLNTGPVENIYPEAAEPITTPEQATASEPQQEQTEPAIPEPGDVVVSFDKIIELKLPIVKSLQAEYSDLLVQKKLDYAELSKARDEAKRLQIYKANAEMLLRTDADDQRQTREHQ